MLQAVDLLEGALCPVCGERALVTAFWSSSWKCLSCRARIPELAYVKFLVKAAERMQRRTGRVGGRRPRDPGKAAPRSGR